MRATSPPRCARESPASNRRVLSSRGMPQRFGVPIHQRVASREERRILRVTFDHVAEFAEVMYQEAEASLVFVGCLQRLQQVGNEIFEFGLLDFERNLERALERDSGGRIALRFFKQ